MTEFLRSKLPDVGTTIFTVMSRRARELGALNLGQGFPDYDIDPRIGELLAQAVRAGHNQYAPMEGNLALRQVIANKLNATYGVLPDWESEVTVTLGATEAIYSAIQAVVGAGDEVIVFDPAYDSYDPAIRLAGGRCVHIPLLPPTFGYDWQRVAATLTPRTRLIIINSPHNPSCTAATAADLDALAAVIRGRNILVLSDEVYEHVMYDGGRHHSVAAHAELAPRAFVVFSFGKTLHATGWRVGYCIAPPPLTVELRRVHQFNTFSIAAPLQQAIAQYLTEKPQVWSELSGFFQAKRDLLRQGLAGSAFKLPPAQGTFFQLLDFSALDQGLQQAAGEQPPADVRFAEKLLVEAGVASIPLSPFYVAAPPMPLVRLCVAKRDATLTQAVSRLLEYAGNAQRR
ncbi:MAG TPA: methionine aminotransferase [Steroidobacteraceae bacterium]|nr:methionine aminotransferase [Steroidobacteraceae bacterium]